MTEPDSSTLKVLNILFEARYGGPKKRVNEVGEALRAYGVRTLLCQPTRHDEITAWGQETKVPVRELSFEHIPRPRDLRRVLRWVVLLPRDVCRFVILFRKEAPDAVHVNGAFFLPPAVAAKLTRVPLVWHLNDTLLPRWMAPLFGGVVRLLANRVVVAAEAVASHYGVPREACEIIYAPVDTERFSPASNTRDSEQHKVPRIGLIANWSPIKGVEDFVQSAALVRERVRDIEVVFAGARLPAQAEYCREVERMIEALGLEPAIRDYGLVASVADILAGLDVLVLSSTTEASPMAVLEGMAAGVPVVATDVGGVREMLLRDPARPAGVVVPPRSPEDTATAVLELLDEPGRATQMGENGRYLAREYFSLEECTRKHLKMYKGLSRRSMIGGSGGA